MLSHRQNSSTAPLFMVELVPGVDLLCALYRTEIILFVMVFVSVQQSKVFDDEICFLDQPSTQFRVRNDYLRCNL